MTTSPFIECFINCNISVTNRTGVNIDLIIACGCAIDFDRLNAVEIYLPLRTTRNALRVLCITDLRENIRDSDTSTLYTSIVGE